MNEEDPNG